MDSRISSQPEAEDIDARGIAALAVTAVLLFAGFLWLGFYVAHHAEPPGLWRFAQALRGRGVDAAWVLTNAGYAWVLGPLFAATAALGVFSPRWRAAAFFVLAVSLVCWGAADYFQHYFARPRRADWLIRHEHAFSYPSSHAAICTGFYFLWGVAVLKHSSGTVWIRWTVFAALALLTVGIMWSRVALAAHYPTDVIAGAVLAASVILLASAVLRTAGKRPFAR